MIFVTILGIGGVPVEFPDTPQIETVNLSNIASFIWDLGGFIIGIMFYSIPNAFIINAVIWGFRVLVIIELIQYFTERVNDIVPL
jgi:hypothetical protein